MLGWEFFIRRQAQAGLEAHKRCAPSLASWRAGMDGAKWLDDLVRAGVAKDLGGDGYPNGYSVSAGALLAVLAHGIPKHDGPFVIGDDYALPSGWAAEVRTDLPALQSLDPQEVLLVEAWDQS